MRISHVQFQDAWRDESLWKVSVIAIVFVLQVESVSVTKRLTCDLPHAYRIVADKNPMLSALQNDVVLGRLPLPIECVRSPRMLR